MKNQGVAPSVPMLIDLPTLVTQKTVGVIPSFVQPSMHLLPW